jgi:hypothetical protein
MIFIKIHKSLRHVVAVCDSNLIGKKFEEGKKQLFLRESFYKGEGLEKKDALKIMLQQAKEDATFNIVGEESINLALEAGIIDKKGISRVAGIPFALALL